MARRKAGDKKVTVGNVTGVSGKVTIAAGDIYEGYTVQQVSLLLKEITTNYRRKPFDGRCPYKGLDVFEEEDADLFFGRERLLGDLLNRVKESRTVFITGPSGSGKSSLVRAGLIHALKNGAIKSSERWLYETMKPGREPIKELSLAFSRLKSPELAHYFQDHANDVDILNECAESVLTGQKSQRFVLFVDQFEEVFTQISQEAERQAFINMLAHAGTVENGRVIVLFAMRSDFVSNCATYPALNELLSQEFRQIGAMQPEELVAAIALPAKEVGLPIEDELIARIINDMKGEPGALPLMQFALKDLFDSKQAQGGVIALTLEDYLRHGGIQKSLERHADASLAALDEEGQNLARSIFSGLIEIGRGTADTKRTALFDELVPANASTDEVLAIVQKLADARLIITDEQAGKDTVTISHEKLIEAWPWLKKLVNENRDVIALQNEIANDAKEWEEHGRDASYLYTGARLANAREQLDAKKLVLSGLAQEFIEVGVKAHTEELDAARQRANQLRRRSVYLTGALVAALIAVGIAVFFGVQSQRQAKLSRADELATLALSEKDRRFDIALLFGLESIHTLDNSRTRGTLLTLLDSHLGLDIYLFGHNGIVRDVTFSPDGRLLASGSDDNTIILWDVSDPTAPSQLATLAAHGYPESMTFSPDGKLLASSSNKKIILWDVRDPTASSQLAILSGDSELVLSMAFSPDGKVLASASNKMIILRDVSDPTAPSQLATLSGFSDWVTSIAFSPDGKLLASGSARDNIILWNVMDPTAPSQLATLSRDGEDVHSVAFSSDGKLLVSGRSNDIELWDIRNRTAPSQLATLAGDRYAFVRVAFRPDGKLLASRSDGQISLWDISNPTTPSQLATFPALGNRSDSVAFRPDGKLIALGSDKTIILLNASDPTAPSQLSALPEPGRRVASVAFSPDGRLLASGSDENTIILWDVSDPTAPSQLATLPRLSSSVTHIAFSPDNKFLASVCVDGTTVLWDVSNPTAPSQLTTLSGLGQQASGVAFGPDGKLLVSGSYDKISLWDVSNPTAPSRLAALVEHIPVFSMALSKDGKLLASGGSISGPGNFNIILWNLSNPTAPSQFVTLSGHSSPVDHVAFSPDSKLLASGSDDNTIMLWDVSNPTAPSHVATLSSGFGNQIAFSPDNKLLASGYDNQTIVLWDLTNPSAPSQMAILSGHSYLTDIITFSPDGRLLVSGVDNNILFFDLDLNSWVKKACQRVGRNFTRVEWAQYFPSEKYRKTCQQWPLEPEVTPTIAP